MKILAATGNKGKVREIAQILGEIGIDVISLKDINLDIDVEENGSTFEENAEIKARAIAEITNMDVIADDSGLCIDALDGRPGIYSARYGGEDASYDEKIAKLLDELKDVEEDKRGAYFVSAVVFITRDSRKFVAEGKAYGKIAYEKSGENGFGYDPIFISDDTNKSFADMTAEEKNKISHRYKALIKLKDILKDNL